MNKVSANIVSNPTALVVEPVIGKNFFFRRDALKEQSERTPTGDFRKIRPWELTCMSGGIAGRSEPELTYYAARESERLKP